ncbi:MAG: hypothetical protein IPF98_18135 [Gemmatimonadetes bacterium]|nr:hypothetical protein [Gemmatimonadota bacterium]MCC6772816.1 hypothetical protein [Gemmatimonadaceae bacterium]
MRRRYLLVLACLLPALAVPAQAQLKGVRFEVTAVGDTTLTFDAGTERWIRRGIEGIAVDPAKRDVLVARLRVLRVDRAGEVTAMVTGQTTAVTRDHVVLLQELQPAWYRRRMFWGGMVLGAALGATAGAQF